MARIVIFGYGNPLRGDDGVGWRVAEAIAEHWAGHLLVRTGHQLVPEWAADLQHAEVVYFVDASIGVVEPKIDPVRPDGEVPPIDGHDLGPAQLLRLTREVFGRAPSGLMVHVPAANFEFGDTLSPVAVSGVRRATCLLDAALGSLL
jgi:hydrogenase maturation protease